MLENMAKGATIYTTVDFKTKNKEGKNVFVKMNTKLTIVDINSNPIGYGTILTVRTENGTIFKIPSVKCYKEN